MKAKKKMCLQFNCDRMHGNYCCAYCKNLKKCKSHCLNDPAKCGLAVEKANKTAFIVNRKEKK